MIHLELVSHDELIASLSKEPIIINDIDVSSMEQKTNLNKLLYTEYKGDTLDILPTCDCGELKGEYNNGLICHSCGTTCESATERNLESLLWIKAPEGITALINPTAWVILSEALSVSGCNLLEWLCNPVYKPAGKPPDKLLRLAQLGIPRGYNHFVENFDAIMDELLEKRIVADKRNIREDIRDFIVQNRNKIFSQYIPIPSRVVFITEDTSVGKFTDMTMTIALDAIRTITSIKSSVTPLSIRSKEIRVVNTIVKLADFYVKFASKTLGAKYGLYRKHIFGGRAHFTARAVISSLSEPHNYEELHTPWGMSVQLMRAHLTNKMLKLGMTPIEIERHINEHTLNYSPLLDKLFNELIDESPYMGIPVILQRNPSLARASAQRFYITKVKTDPSINTISISTLALVGPNADKMS